MLARFLTERITQHPVVVVVVSIYPHDDVCIFFLPVTRGLEPGASTEFRENTSGCVVQGSAVQG